LSPKEQKKGSFDACENSVMTNAKCLMISVLLIFLSACAPEIGSDAWCKSVVDKDKGDWSSNEVTEFARSCIFKDYSED
jgi:hypothetical protein